MSNLLHVYAQGQWHGDAWLVGDREGLTALRDAVDRALTDGSAACEAFVDDGEGYAVLVVHLDHDGPWGRMRSPYIAEYCGRGGPVEPLDILPTGRYLELHDLLRKKP